MKNYFTLIAAILFSFTALNAQQIETPLQDMRTSEFVPDAPTSNHVWVKGHYEYKSGKYYWIDGAYVLNVPNHVWVDAMWVQNEGTGMYEISPGFWKSDAQVIIHNGIAYQPGVVTNLSKIEITYDQMLSDATE